MTLRAVDVHGFGGGFTLGTVQAGFDLVGKMSREAGFGVYNTLANRGVLGRGWESITGSPADWEVVDADFVFGNPPCSGFSTLSSKAFRGMDSSINDYMWELIRYAGRVAPPIVAWESVQQTFRQGLPLMRELHDELEKISGQKYTLYHVLHNNLSHGGIAMRKRYFWVASRVPFGVDLGRVTRDGEFADLDHVPTFGQMLSDLEPLGLTMADQPYRGVRITHEHDDDEGWQQGRTELVGTSLWNVREAHDGTGLVDGHDVYHSKTLNRTEDLLRQDGVVWGPNENMATVMKRLWQERGKLPYSWNYLTKVTDPETGEIKMIPKWQRLVDTDFAMGHNQPVRWSPNDPPKVITGGAVHLYVHPTLPRLLTHREAARIQGFPDDWKIWPVRKATDLGPGWGKGVPVQAGRWIARWARAALEGEPGPITGQPLHEVKSLKQVAKHYEPREREYVIDTTYAFRDVLPKES